MNTVLPQQVRVLIRGRKTFLNTADIEYIEGRNNYIIYHLINRREVLMARTLMKASVMLGPTFLRISKTHLVNRDDIASVAPLKGTLTLRSKTVLGFSRRRLQKLLPELIEFLKTADQ